MKMRNTIYTICICLLLGSCSFFEVEPQIITSTNYYKTPEDALHALAGVYGVMSNEGFYGNYYTFDCSYVDDLCYINRAPTDVAEVMNLYQHSPSTAEVHTVWTEIYEGIKNANAFMNNITQTEFDKDGKLYAEARFLRAYYHFLLAQAWGNIPLRDSEVRSADEVECEATSQYDVLIWVADEMETCVETVAKDLANTPSRVVKTTVQGILARVYLFLAGESVQGGEKKDFYKKAMDYSDAVIQSKKHMLNPDYTQVFKNMISDKYEQKYCESMWEVEFLGARESADRWTNGRIGGLNGLQNTNIKDYSKVNANYAEGRYNGSLKLWDLYFSTDTINYAGDDKLIDDVRLEWNIPPYNYKDDGVTKSGIVYLGKNALTTDPLTGRAIRNVGKWRREVEYEGVIGVRMMYTGINFPILRYSDVLLMYAEAAYEYTGVVSEQAYNCVLAVRERALGIGKTYSHSHYVSNPEEFRQFVRNERGRELCFEATRKYDLIRWGEFVQNMNEYVRYTADTQWSGNGGLASYAATVGSNVQSKHILQPIPLKELGTNRKLKQNPLW